MAKKTKAAKTMKFRAPGTKRISAFERGLVNWIDESYDPDKHLEGRWQSGTLIEYQGLLWGTCCQSYLCI